jgi:beta-phosphoglucomutase
MSLLRGPGLDSADLTSTRKKSAQALKAVIFDMDGVIINSHPAHRTAWRRFLRELGRDVSESELDFILDGRKRADILRYFLGNLTDSELEEQGRRKDEFFKEVSLDVNPIAGVLDFLAQLEAKKISIAVATSATESRARSTLAQLGVSGRFQVVVTGSDVKQGKPDPAIYQLTCNRLRLQPENVLAVEDAVSGIRAAKSAGLRCIGIAPKGFAQPLIDAGAEFVVGDFSEISIEQLEAVLARGR